MTLASSGSHHMLKNGVLLVVAGLLFHAGVLLSLSKGFFNPFFDDAMHRAGQGVDFFAVYQAGQNVVDGVSIYSTDPPRQVVPFYNPYRYHPVPALTLGVAARSVPPFVAYGIWIIILELLLLMNIILSRRLFEDEADANRATALWLLFSPYYLELYMGQFSFLMMTFMFWAMAAWARRQWARGDAFWITSLVVKSNSVLFAPVLLREKRWKPVLAGAVISIALAAPYFILVPGSYREFARNFSELPTVQTLFGNHGYSALVGITTLRLSGLWTDYVQEFVTRLDAMNALLGVAVTCWTILIVGTTLFLTWKARKGQTIELLLLWTLAYFLFYKHVWEHQYVMMIPVFVLLYWRIKSGVLRISLNLFWILFAVIALPTVFIFVDRSPVLFDPEIHWSIWESMIVHAPKPIATLVLYGALSFAMFNHHSMNNLSTTQ